MSSQLRAAKKRKHDRTRQKGIGGFLEVQVQQPPLHVMDFHGGAIICKVPGCKKSIYSTQGYTSHMRMHQSRGDPTLGFKFTDNDRPGRVRVRTDLMSPKSIRKYEQEREARLQGEIIELDGNDSDSNASGNSTNVTSTATDMELDIPDGNVNDTNDAAERDNEGDCEAPDETTATTKKAARTRGVNFSPKEIVQILDQYHEYCEKLGRENKKGFVREVMRNPNGAWKKPKFQAGTLRNLLDKEEEYRTSAKSQNSDRRRLGLQRQPDGRYPEMELRLAAQIRHLREWGIPVETWMIKFEGRQIFHDIYPELYQPPSLDVEQDDLDDAYPIKFSDRYIQNFMKRHKFSYRKIGTKINKKGVTEGMMEAIQEYHTKIRDLQLSEMNDPTYGLTSPDFVLSHDQVPIELSDKNETTLETTGADEVYDAVTNDNDTKRFCTLNLFGVMRTLADGSNLPKPHVVFKGTFQGGDDWHDPKEREQWDQRVVVSFH